MYYLYCTHVLYCARLYAMQWNWHRLWRHTSHNDAITRSIRTGKGHSIDRTEHDYLLLMCGCGDWMGLHVHILWSIAVRGVETEARAADANNRAVREEAGQMHRHDPQAAPREGVLLVLLLLLLPPSSFLLPAPLPFATLLLTLPLHLILLWVWKQIR